MDAIPVPSDIWKFLEHRVRPNGTVRASDLMWAIISADASRACAIAETPSVEGVNSNDVALRLSPAAMKGAE